MRAPDSRPAGRKLLLYFEVKLRQGFSEYQQTGFKCNSSPKAPSKQGGDL